MSIMPEFKIQSTQNRMMRQMSQHCERQLIQFISMIKQFAKIDEIMIGYLQSLLHEKQITSLQTLPSNRKTYDKGRLLIAKAIKIYEDSNEIVDEQFVIMLKNTKKIAPEIKIYQKIREISLLIKGTLDLVFLKENIERVSQQIKIIEEDKKNENIFLLAKWKLECSLFFIECKLNKKFATKNRIMILLKIYSKLYKSSLISKTFAAKFLLRLTSMLLSIESEHLVFAQLQLQRLWNLGTSDLSSSQRKQISLIISACKQKGNQAIMTQNHKALQHQSSRAWQSKIITSPFNDKCSQNLLKQISILAKPRHLAHSMHFYRNVKKSEDKQKNVSGHKSLNQSVHFYPKRVSMNDSNRSLKQNMTSEFELPLKSQQQTKKDFQSKKQVYSGNSTSQKCTSRRLKMSMHIIIPRRKRQNIYMSIGEHVNRARLITETSLKNEIQMLPSLQFERCKITFKQIIFDCRGLDNVQSKNISFHGCVKEDKIFDVLSFQFIAAYRNETVRFQVKQRRVEDKVLIGCTVISSNCFSFKPFDLLFQVKKQITMPQLREMISRMHIYFQAIQQKVQNFCSQQDIEYTFKLLKQTKSMELSQVQITDILQMKEIIEYYYYFYYTKRQKVVGADVFKRKVQQIADDMNFSISLLGLKSDYLSCLDYFFSCQNQTSMKECFEYLSFGRLLFCQQIIKDAKGYHIQTFSIGEGVYNSFSLRGEHSQFKDDRAYRKVISMSKWKQVKVDEIRLYEFFQEKDLLIFLLRNTIQNCIMKKVKKYTLEVISPKYHPSFIQKLPQTLPVLPPTLIQSEIHSIHYGEFHLSLTSPALQNFITILYHYFQIYVKPNCYLVYNQYKAIIKISGKFYQCRKFELMHGCKLLKVKQVGRSAYLILLHNQTFQVQCGLNHILRPFFKKLVIRHPFYNKSIANLTKNNQKQEYLFHQFTHVLHKLCRTSKSYYYLSLSRSKILNCTRIDIYVPLSQRHFVTFIELRDVKQWQWQDAWNKKYHQLKIDFQNNILILGSHKYVLVESFGSLCALNQFIQGKIELIQFDNRLFYLICLFTGSLNIGEVEQNPFTFNVNIFSDASYKQMKITVYSSLLTRLYTKFADRKLGFRQMRVGEFKSQ